MSQELFFFQIQQIRILQFVARKQNGSAFPVASLKGTLHAASWNEIGLAAVVGRSLYVWQAGAKNVLRLLTDQGLSDAKDVVLVGPGRAVVTMRNTIVLVTPESMTIVMKMSLARARYQQGVLYLLDTRTGLIWALRGLDRLGNMKDDQTYAMELLRQVPTIGDRNSVQFLEAARIIGCSSAMQQLTNLRSAH